MTQHSEGLCVSSGVEDPQQEEDDFEAEFLADLESESLEVGPSPALEFLRLSTRISRQIGALNAGFYRSPDKLQATETRGTIHPGRIRDQLEPADWTIRTVTSGGCAEDVWLSLR